MIIKSFKISDLKKIESKMYLFYGENEGYKNDAIETYFIKEFDGEIIKYDENEILNDKDQFIEDCLNESLFSKKKIIIISRVTSKLYEVIKDLFNRQIHDKKIILNSGVLEKKSRIRQLFEKENTLVCIAFYQDNTSTLYKIASDFFSSNKIPISSENINLIIEKCLGDRNNLKNEMNKILNFCYQKNKISADEIKKLINYQEEDNYFELVDFCLSKNKLKVCKIINNNNYKNTDSIILIRSFVSRIKRLLELKKLQGESGNVKSTIENFRPPIFWKDKETVEKQLKSWSIKDAYKLFDEITELEINYKKNSNLSNNLIFDLILNSSNN